MSTNKGCAPGKSSLIGLGSARDYGGCAILHHSNWLKFFFFVDKQVLVCYSHDRSVGISNMFR